MARSFFGQIQARWRGLTPEQRMAVGVGAPAVAGFALWQRQRAGGDVSPEEATTDEDAGTILGGATGYAGAGYGGSFFGSTPGGYDSGDSGALAVAQAAGAAAAEAQATNVAQDLRLKRQNARVKKLRAKAVRQAEKNTKQNRRLKRQHLQIKKLRAKSRRRAEAVGGPAPVAAIEYAPGLVMAGGALGAVGIGGVRDRARAVPQAVYVPPAVRRAGALAPRPY